MHMQLMWRPRLAWCGVARYAVSIACTLAAVTGAPAVVAQQYPTKPVRLVSPFAPGGGTDILGRAIAGGMSEVLGQTVVVDNRPGAGGAIGAELTANAAPDGYTFIMVSASYTATAAHRKPAYDPVNDIQPVILIGTTGLAVVMHPGVPVRNAGELIAYAKANPGKLNYASVGPGSLTHLALEYFKLQTKTGLTHVPYKGSGPALLALVAGEVQMSALSVVPTLPHVKAGRLRAIGVTSVKRSNVMPEVGTIGETVPGFEALHWYGIWGPKGLPKPIVTRWNRDVAKILQGEEMRSKLSSEGLEPAGGPPEEFGDVIKREVEKWRRVVKEADIRG